MSKRTHRELMTDPMDPPKRKWKNLGGETSSGFAMYTAWSWGQAAAGAFSPVPRRYQTNPYPPGRRRDEYERGYAAWKRGEH